MIPSEPILKEIPKSLSFSDSNKLESSEATFLFNSKYKDCSPFSGKKLQMNSLMTLNSSYSPTHLVLGLLRSPYLYKTVPNLQMFLNTQSEFRFQDLYTWLFTLPGTLPSKTDLKHKDEWAFLVPQGVGWGVLFQHFDSKVSPRTKQK